jgi:GT2 family glycosyltransferase
LRQTLPPLVRELPPDRHEILVIDDASRDDSVEVLRREFPGVRVIPLKENVGFGAVCNRGFSEAQHGIVLLLNSDMQVTPGSVAALSEHLAEPDVFAAGPRYVDAGEEAGPRDDVSEFIRPQFGSPAGGGLFCREKFLALGGFDPLYHPFYWEDIDLGWNAWRRGWRVIEDTRSDFIHLVGATIGALYDEGYVTRIRDRNRCLFGWKNLSSPRLLVRHGWAVARKALGDLLKRRSLAGALGFASALAMLPRVVRSRRSVTPGLSDAEIMGRIGERAWRLFSV